MVTRLVNCLAFATVLPGMKLLTVFSLALCIASAALADVPADQAERARLLRELLEDASPARATGRPAAELPGAKLDAAKVQAQIQANREQLQMQQFQDGEWRRLLGEQQAGRIRQEMTGIPSSSAPARAMGFERDQRMRDLSMRIQQQDLQFRLNGQR